MKHRQPTPLFIPPNTLRRPMLVTWHHTIFIGNGPSCNHSFTLLVALHKACATHSLVPYRTHFPNPLPRGPERRVTHDVPHSPQSSPRSPSFPSESLFLSITPPAVARTCWRTRWGAPCDAVGHTADISASHAPSLGPTGWRPGLEAGACLASTHFPRNSRSHVRAAFCLVPGPADRYRRPRPPNTRAMTFALTAQIYTPVTRWPLRSYRPRGNRALGTLISREPHPIPRSSAKFWLAADFAGSRDTHTREIGCSCRRILLTQCGAPVLGAAAHC